MDAWKVEGLQGLSSAGFYGEQGSGSHENRKDFLPNHINAVVVLDDPYRQNNPQPNHLVILTNAPVDKPLTVYDGYDAEVFILCGTTVLKPEGVRETVSKRDILIKYGVALE